MSMSRCRRLALLGGCLLGMPILAFGQVQTLLTLQAAIDRSLSGNPELKAFGYELTAQEARIEQASARAPMEMGMMVENVLGTGAHSGVKAAETTLTLGWLLERSARERRVDVAQAGLSVLQDDARVKRLDVAAETARRYLEVLRLQQQLVETRQASALAEETQRAVQIRVEAAKAPDAESARAYSQLARARLDEEQVEHELQTAKLRLTALWGQSASTSASSTLVIAGDLLILPPLRDFESLRTQLQQNPELLHLVTTQRLREAEIKLAESRRRLPWQVNVGVRRLEASDDQALIAGMTIPFGNPAASQGAVKLARAQAAQTLAQTESLNVQLGVELFALYQDLKHAYTAVDSLRDEVLPRMNEAMEQSRYAYERGRYSYMEWVAAQRELTEMRRALLEAAANAHRYRIEIERLTGAALTQLDTP